MLTADFTNSEEDDIMEMVWLNLVQVKLKYEESPRNKFIRMNK